MGIGGLSNLEFDSYFNGLKLVFEMLEVKTNFSLD